MARHDEMKNLRARDDQYQMVNASGAVAVAFKGYYSPQRYDNNQTNQTTARDLAIMTYNFIKKYPRNSQVH